MNIVFMGTPEFAVESLELLIKKHNVVGVFTQPDKPKGRKYVLTPPPVKVVAQRHNIPVFQPKSVKNSETVRILQNLAPDLIVVVAYGKILPDEILSLPKYGCINIHASLLPRHRGASPIQWCIVCGDKKTGVTSMQMDSGMDTGDMLIKKELEILPEETADELHDRLAALGAEVLDETLQNLANGTLKAVAQPTEGVTYAPIIKKEMAHINFNLTAEEIVNAVRGYNSWPCAYFVCCGKRIKVYSAKISDRKGNIAEVLESSDSFIVGCKDKSVEFTVLQSEGSKRMPAADMLRGKPIPLGTVLE